MIARAIGLAALIVLGALAGTVANLPAARAVDWLAPSNVDATGVAGTVWAGRAQRVAFGGPKPITDAEWDLSAWRLLTGRLAGEVGLHLGDAQGRGRFAIGPGGEITLHQARLEGAAAPLVALAELPAVAVDGDILAHIDEARFVGRRPEQVRARLQWSEARLIAPMQLELGNVRGRVEPRDNGGHVLKLSNQAGQVNLDGTITVDAEDNYRVDVRIRPTSDAPPRIAETLNQFLPRRNGAFVVQRSGRLPG
jgi:hypothetical protein